MIPKVIHYCWFGGNKLPNSVERCIASWKKYCPDYKIIQWNEDNFDVRSNSYIDEAYKMKKYAFVSDYARLDIIYTYGGIYLDTDVELVKPLDEILNNKCFMALEQPDRVDTGLGFGAIKGSKFVKLNLDEYKNEHFYQNGIKNNKTCIDYTMSALNKVNCSVNCGSLKNSAFQEITIYPQRYFCPYNLKTRKLNVTEDTIAIHHYDATWYSQNNLVNKIQRSLIPVKMYIHQGLDWIFGTGTYNRLKHILKRGS